MPPSGLTSAFAISATLRLHQEESTGRAETVLAGAVPRTRWLAGYLALALTSSAVIMLAAGAFAGLTYAASAGDIGVLSTVIGSALVQLPGVWLLAAVTVLLIGWVPRAAPAAWAVLVGFVALFLLGSLAGFPRWLQNLDPYSHAPSVGTGAFTAWPLIWLLALDALLIAVGAAAFGRRDVG